MKTFKATYQLGKTLKIKASDFVDAARQADYKIIFIGNVRVDLNMLQFN